MAARQKSMKGRRMRETVVAAVSDPIKSRVIKATDSAESAPKQKHIAAIVKFSFNPDISIELIGQEIIERTSKASWIVVIKALIAHHALMRDGSPRYAAYMSTRSSTFDLGAFMDRKTVHGQICSDYIRKYNTFLNEKLLCIRKIGFDFGHIEAEKRMQKIVESGAPHVYEPMREIMKLLAQSSTTLVSDPTNANLMNIELIKHVAILIFRDTLRMVRYLQDCMCKLLERTGFFKMNKQDAIIALGTIEDCIKHLEQVDKFFEVCKEFGANDGLDVDELSKAPASVLPQLRGYVQNYGKKENSGNNNIDGTQWPTISAPNTIRFSTLSLDSNTSSASNRSPAVVRKDLGAGNYMEIEAKGSEVQSPTSGQSTPTTSPQPSAGEANPSPPTTPRNTYENVDLFLASPPATITTPQDSPVTTNNAGAAPTNGSVFSHCHITPEQLPVYEVLWQKATGGADVLGPGSAVRFLKATGFPDRVLGAIWNIADANAPKGKLNKEEFFTAAKLIAIKQDGLEVAKENLQTPTPLPLIGEHTAAAQAAVPQPEPEPVSEPEVSSFDKVENELWERIAGKANSEGFVDGGTCASVLKLSKLPQKDLAKIWSAVDSDKKGKVNRDQFKLLLGGIAQVQQGGDFNLDSVKENPSKVAPNMDGISH
eukprot:m.18856 g.18856  ORF g.18856 m.18856 type:complete len:654 (+) comp6427_c0_seq2:309-2270(+)